MKRPTPLTAALLAVLLAGSACSSDDGNDADGERGSARERVAAFACPERATDAGADRDGPADGERLLVVTTVAPLTSIAANVAGDLADVRGLVPEGADSHTFEPKPSVAADLTDADLVVVNGLQLEEPTVRLAEANIGPDAQIIELGDLTLDDDQHLYDFSFPKSGGMPNPHLWTNPPMARCYAETVAGVLAKADPDNADAYRTNAETYTARIDELDRLMVEATATVPEGNRRLLTYHDAYAYFAAHYGWTVVGAVQVSDFEDPSPKEVVRLIEQIRDEKIPAVFGSEVFPSGVLAEIARESGATYHDKLRDDDLPGGPGDPDHSYLGLMQFDFVTMVEALGGDADDLKAFDPTDTVVDEAFYPQ
ncbi:MAG: metal ABC transporter substrate-binding protein [Aquihabitans sp.]